MVALSGPGTLPGRLHGYRRFWGAAMDNWEGGEDAKHWLDRASGERPHIRVAYLDLREEPGSAVDGLALPVEGDRLAALDAREINYERIDVTDAFEPAGDLPSRPLRVLTYVGTAAARERCRSARADGDGFVARDYLAGVRAAFADLDDDALTEFDRTTDPLPFPERDLKLVQPPPETGS